MTYKELLNLYKKGELSDEQKNQVKYDIDRQEAISEFLFENGEIPELTDSSLEAEITGDDNSFEEKNFQKMIKKSIRKAFVKLGVTVGVLVLIIVLVANTALPHIVDSMYYNPAKIVGTSENGNETNQITLDTAVYTELFTPGYYRTQAFADSEGFGKYDIEILQSFSVNGQFNNVSGNIERGKLTLFDDAIFKLPTQNTFLSDRVEGMAGYATAGAAGSAEDALKKLNELDESDYYVAYVTFDKVMTYDELVAWSNASRIEPDWCAVCQKDSDSSYPYFTDKIIGFNYSSGAAEAAYDSEKYPYLNFFDVIGSVDDYSVNQAAAEVMEKHMTSMLRYMADNKDFRDMVGSIMGDGELLSLAKNIEEHGLNIYGFAITAQKDKLMEISKNENVSYIYTTPLV